MGLAALLQAPPPPPPPRGHPGRPGLLSCNGVLPQLPRLRSASPLCSITIGAHHFPTVDAAWDHIGAVKRRLLGRYVRPGDPDFE